MKTHRNCIFNKCSLKHSRMKRTFHALPKDSIAKEKWKDFITQQFCLSNGNPNWQSLPKSKHIICSLHFVENDFHNFHYYMNDEDVFLRLRPEAFPTVPTDEVDVNFWLNSSTKKSKELHNEFSSDIISTFLDDSIDLPKTRQEVIASQNVDLNLPNKFTPVNSSQNGISVEEKYLLDVKPDVNPLPNNFWGYLSQNECLTKSTVKLETESSEQITFSESNAKSNTVPNIGLFDSETSVKLNCDEVVTYQPEYPIDVKPDVASLLLNHSSDSSPLTSIIKIKEEFDEPLFDEMNEDNKSVIKSGDQEISSDKGNSNIENLPNERKLKTPEIEKRKSDSPKEKKNKICKLQDENLLSELAQELDFDDLIPTTNVQNKDLFSERTVSMKSKAKHFTNNDIVVKLETLLFEWLEEQNRQSIYISNSNLRSKAMFLYKELLEKCSSSSRSKSFTPTISWCRRLKMKSQHNPKPIDQLSTIIDRRNLIVDKQIDDPNTECEMESEYKSSDSEKEMDSESTDSHHSMEENKEETHERELEEAVDLITAGLTKLEVLDASAYRFSDVRIRVQDAITLFRELHKKNKVDNSLDDPSNSLLRLLLSKSNK